MIEELRGVKVHLVYRMGEGYTKVEGIILDVDDKFVKFRIENGGSLVLHKEFKSGDIILNKDSILILKRA